jgi:signal transduction histidine kinase/ActR/RegA family two-component response regulator
LTRHPDPDPGPLPLAERVALLSAATEALLSTLDVRDILRTIGESCALLLPSDSTAVWHFTESDQMWRVAWSRGLSETFIAEVTNHDSGVEVPFAAPLFIPDVTAHPLLARRPGLYEQDGIRALLVVPLTIRERRHGSVVSYFRRPATISDADLQMATTLGHLGSFALTAAEVARLDKAYRVAAEQAQWRAQFLARAAGKLGSSLDYEQTLRDVAQLAVPDLADWCAVDLVDDGQIKRVAVAHSEPEKVELARQLRERYPEDPNSQYGIYEVVRTRQPIMMARIPEALLVASARSADHLEVIRALGLTSYMSVPMLIENRVVGVLTFVSAESGKEYSENDLHFAMEVASRAAFAVVNARAYEEVRRANQLKDDFFATLSHELRTPLNAILGYARLLRAGGLPEDRRPLALQAVERNAVALTQIVEDVLDVSRIVAGKIRLNVQRVDLAKVLSEAIATLGPAADAKGVRVHAVLDETVPPVSGDPDRLQQVAWNVLSNAVKFTPRGGRIHIRLEPVESHLEITVTDTGVGIRQDFLPHIFERFRQADSRPSREHGGLGLGLAIARHLIELHGGEISATSGGEGLGSTFRIKLPSMIVQQPEPRPPERVHPRAVSLGPAQPVIRLDGLHVLVVDDEADALALVEDILKAAGARVSLASSGFGALDALKREIPDVIISDVGMPGMDGLQLISRIRAMAAGRSGTLPALALTAYARSEDRIRALQAGFQMHLAKPINPPELVAAVRALKPRTS